MKIVDLRVERRDKLGSAHSRRYRRAGRIPCILYGRKQETVPLTILGEDFGGVLKAHTALVRLTLGDDSQTALIREIKWDTFGDHVEHVDLARVDLSEEVKITVPLTYVGTPAGASTGGVVHAIMTDLEVMSRVDSIPSEITIDISRLEIGDAVTVGDVTYPEHVKPVPDPGTHLVHVQLPKKVEEPSAEAEPAEGAAPEGEGAAAPTAES
jgi:large subunit ribosomal protein L25